MQGALRSRWNQKFVKLHADGIDFVSCDNNLEKAEIYASYTKDDFFKLDDYNYPRSKYVFWRMLFGNKCYIQVDKQQKRGS